MEFQQFTTSQVSRVAELEQQNDILLSSIDYVSQAVSDVERERDSHLNEIEYLTEELDAVTNERDVYADVFDAVSEDYDNLSETARRAISDLRTLPEVPLNELESSIDSIIEVLRKAL